MAPVLGFSLHVTVYIDPANVEKFFEYFKPAYDAVIAEPELLFFEVYQSPTDPGTLRWVENWSKPVEWFTQEQMTKAYYKPYIEGTEPMYLKPRDFQIYSRVGTPYYTVKET